MQSRVSALETELRKSKRAEQKLQALLFRLRQDVAELQANPSLFDQLQDVRSLEYEVDFLTNKCKASPAAEGSTCVVCGNLQPTSRAANSTQMRLRLNKLLVFIFT